MTEQDKYYCRLLRMYYEKEKAANHIIHASVVKHAINQIKRNRKNVRVQYHEETLLGGNCKIILTVMLLREAITIIVNCDGVVYRKEEV